MKKKVIKIFSVACVLAALLAAMVMPSAAASGRDLVSIDFNDPLDANKFVDDFYCGSSFSYDLLTGRIASTGDNLYPFVLTTYPGLLPSSGCYFFTLGLWCEYSWTALPFSIKYRYNGMEYELFRSSQGKLWQSGSAVCNFDGNRIYLTCVVDLYAERAYWSISNDSGTVVSYREIDTRLLGNPTSAEDRMLYIYFTNNPTTNYVEMSNLKIREIPAVFMQSLNNQYTDGFDMGYQEGQNSGYNSGYDSGYHEGLGVGYGDGYEAGVHDTEYPAWDRGYKNGFSDGFLDGEEAGLAIGYDEGYAVGKADGYQQGAKDTYNDAFQSTLDKIDENEGTLTQGFLAGMWNGVQSFVQELLDGITFSGLSLRSIVTTLFAIVIAAFVIKIVKGG